MHFKRYRVPVTTSGAGAATVYTPRFTGYVHSIAYLKTDFDDGGTIAVTAERTGHAIWAEAALNASAFRLPRVPVHSAAAGAAIAGIADMALIIDDRVKLIVAAGGNAKTGAFEVTVITE